MKTLGLIIVIVIVAMGLGFWLFKSSKQAQAPENLPGQAFEILGAEHITEGLTDHPAYNSNPPTSGWHWPKPATWGVYNEQQPDERLIHNLEHGGIWISYKPDLSPDQIEMLKDYARRYRKMIVEPRAANDANVVLAAWGRLQKLDTATEGEIIRFVEAFYDKGPEKVD